MSNDATTGRIRATQADNLPYFRRPPVVESVLGVQFDQLEKLNSARLALFWQSLGIDRWPESSDAPPLEMLSEKFGEKREWVQPGIGIRFGIPKGMRLQIRNQSDDRMVQVQNGRFHYNWRKQRVEDEYPRYETVRSEFDENYGRFVAFVADNELGCVRPNLWEVTYVNLIEQGSLWQSVSDWATVLPGLLGYDDAGERRKLQSAQGNWHYELGSSYGNLYISVQHAKKSDDDKGEAIRLQLIARGPIKDDPGYDLDAGLNLGHESIVSAFDEITSEAAHEHWERRPS